jgi:flagellar biosynthesis protein FliR
MSYFVYSARNYQYDFTAGTDLIPFIFGEVFIGVFMGLLVLMLYYAVQLGGQMVDFVSGLMMAASYDPVNNTQASIYGRIYNIMFMVMFVVMNGPFFIIDALVKSYEAVPYTIISNGVAFTIVGDVLTKSFVYGIQLAIPLVIIIFITDLSVGFLSRTIPQINVFIIGSPIKLLVSYVITLMFMSAIAVFMKDIIQAIAEVLYSVAKLV